MLPHGLTVSVADDLRRIGLSEKEVPAVAEVLVRVLQPLGEKLCFSETNRDQLNRETQILHELCQKLITEILDLARRDKCRLKSVHGQRSRAIDDLVQQALIKGYYEAIDDWTIGEEDGEKVWKRSQGGPVIQPEQLISDEALLASLGRLGFETGHARLSMRRNGKPPASKNDPASNLVEAAKRKANEKRARLLSADLLAINVSERKIPLIVELERQSRLGLARKLSECFDVHMALVREYGVLRKLCQGLVSGLRNIETRAPGRPKRISKGHGQAIDAIVNTAIERNHFHQRNGILVITPGPLSRDRELRKKLAEFGFIQDRGLAARREAGFSARQSQVPSPDTAKTAMRRHQKEIDHRLRGTLIRRHMFEKFHLSK